MLKVRRKWKGTACPQPLCHSFVMSTAGESVILVCADLKLHATVCVWLVSFPFPLPLFNSFFMPRDIGILIAFSLVT